MQLSEGRTLYADWDRDGEKGRDISIRYRRMRRRIHHPLPPSRTGEGQRREAAGPWEAGGLWEPHGRMASGSRGWPPPSYGLEFSSENDLRALEVFALQNENGTLTLLPCGLFREIPCMGASSEIRSFSPVRPHRSSGNVYGVPQLPTWV